MKYLLLIILLSIFSNNIHSEEVNFEQYNYGNEQLFLPKSKQYYSCNFDVKRVVSFYAGDSAYMYSYFSMKEFEDQIEAIWKDIQLGNDDSKLANMILPVSGPMNVMYSKENFLYLSPVDERTVQQRILLIKGEKGIYIGQEYLKNSGHDKKRCTVVTAEKIAKAINNLINE